MIDEHARFKAARSEMLGGLFLLTGVLTGHQTLRHFLQVVWGAPPNWFALAALLGSALLALVGTRMLLKRTIWVIAATIGLGLEWLFYVPALHHTITSFAKLPIEVRNEHGLEFLIVLVPPALLLMTSLACVVSRIADARAASPRLRPET